MQLTARQQEIKARLDRGMGAREIGQELGISRNAVYQQITKMRRNGVLPGGRQEPDEPTNTTIMDDIEALKQRQHERLAQIERQENAHARALDDLRAERDVIDRLMQRLDDVTEVAPAPTA